MKISWKNIENWRSWKMRFFWGGHFEFFKSAILNFFLPHLSEKPSPFIWGIIFFCTMDGFSRILEKKLSELLCTRLYLYICIYVISAIFDQSWKIEEEDRKVLLKLLLTRAKNGLFYARFFEFEVESH